MKISTKVVHAGIKPDEVSGAIMPPIYQTSTYVQTEHKGYEYARTQNPTRDILQQNLAEIENGKHAICFSSGMAAEDAVVKLLSSGDEVISVNDLYGGTYRLLRQIYSRFGVTSHFIDMHDVNAIEEYVNENTKMIWLETPTNPILNIVDIEGAAQIAKKHDLLLVVDNTFASPYLQLPLDLGADIVVHSATKYLGGHSDVVHGCAITSDDKIGEDLLFLQNAVGAVPAPQDCFLVLRGIKTLAVRMRQHCENAKLIAHFLKGHPKVDKLYWPGFEDHPNHEIAKRQMVDFGGMVSFSLKGNVYDEAVAIMSKTKLFFLAESLGGVESLIGHPASMTHASIPKEERELTGVVDSLIRLSVGIEDPQDLVEDIKQALA